MVTCWWATAPAPGNLGDVLTPIVLGRLGMPVRWESRKSARMIAIGSVLQGIQPGQCAWGSGVMRSTDLPNPEGRVFAVRGPLTRGRVLEAGGTCPEIYGDPALLLPEFHDRAVRKRWEIGLVPHYVDTEEAAGLGLPTISPLTEYPLDTVDRIRACRSVLSSSLHGLVIAQAYGIPWAWLRLGDRLCGDDVKFHDFAASVGVEAVPYERVEDAAFVLGEAPPAGPLLGALGAMQDHLGRKAA